MKKQRLKAVALSTVLSASALLGSVAQADTLDSIIKVGQSKTTLAQNSQKRIDKLATETQDLLQEFKRTNKSIEDLRYYNGQLDKQIVNQLVVINELETSIENVTVIERRVQPLIMRMLDGIEQFINLDIPFDLDTRLAELEKVKDNLDRSDVSAAEKFRQVLELYKQEAEYSRGVRAYADTLDVGGQEREVNVLQIGRVALMYQTKDTKMSGAWDSEQNAWVELDTGEYRSGILKAIRIARKEASAEVLSLPVMAPEAWMKSPTSRSHCCAIIWVNSA